MTNFDSSVETVPKATGEKVKVVDNVKAYIEYRRSSAELRRAWNRTSQESAAQILHDESGREIHGPGYIAGLRLGGILTKEEAAEVHRDMVSMFTSRLGAFDDTTGPTLSTEQLEMIGPDLSIPIVEIPQVTYNPKGMSEKQKSDLAALQRSVARSGSVMMQTDMRHRDDKGGFGREEKRLPEGLGMEKDADYKFELFFTPSFKNERAVAEKIIQSVLDIPIIAQRRSSIGLPAGTPFTTPQSLPPQTG